VTYEEWIEQYFGPKRATPGWCKTACDDLAKAFPELTPVPGFARTPLGGFQEHWWCVAPDGAIVDPTAAQFDAHGGVVAYEPAQPDDLVRVGKCMDCGFPIFDRFDAARPKTFCDAECERAFTAYMDGAPHVVEHAEELDQ
jgi:hypothetical protein